jgi:thiol-disulfide isomerase/thioredoxin
MVTKVTDSEFLELLKDNPKVVVKYYADWCGNCRLFTPKFNKLSEKEEYKDVKFLDINAETNPQARKLADVKNLPTFAVFKNGELVKADFTSKEDVVDRLIQEIAR